jgi:hypothetical protein
MSSNPNIISEELFQQLLENGTFSAAPETSKGAAPFLPQDDRGDNFSATLSPTLQHDGVFVQTAQPDAIKSPTVALSPLPAATAAQVQSTVTKVLQSTVEESSPIKFTVNGTPLSSQTNLGLNNGTNVTVEDTGNGQVIFNGPGGTSTPYWPLPNNGLVYMARAIYSQTGLQTIGDNSTNTNSAGSGSVNAGTLPTSTDGLCVQMSTGTSANSCQGYYPNAGQIFWAGRDNQFQCRFRFVNTAGMFLWFGFSTLTPTNLRPPLTSITSTVCAFLYDFNTLDLYGVIGDGGGTGAYVTTILSQLPLIGANQNSFEIICNDTANTTEFYINGVNVGGFTGQNVSGTGWFPMISLCNLASGADATINLEYFYAQQDF